jgi:hypothetical protein
LLIPALVKGEFDDCGDGVGGKLFEELLRNFEIVLKDVFAEVDDQGGSKVP